MTRRDRGELHRTRGGAVAAGTGLDVAVVAPETVPMERILGMEVGTFIRRLHEQHGVTFHLDTTVASMSGDGVTLSSGATLPADLVVVGIGVRPAVALGVMAGLAVEQAVREHDTTPLTASPRQRRALLGRIVTDSTPAGARKDQDSSAVIRAAVRDPVAISRPWSATRSLGEGPFQHTLGLATLSPLSDCQP